MSARAEPSGYIYIYLTVIYEKAVSLSMCHEICPFVTKLCHDFLSWYQTKGNVNTNEGEWVNMWWACRLCTWREDMLVVFGGVAGTRLKNNINVQSGYKGVIKIIVHRNLRETKIYQWKMKKVETSVLGKNSSIFDFEILSPKVSDFQICFSKSSRFSDFFRFSDFRFVRKFSVLFSKYRDFSDFLIFQKFQIFQPNKLKIDACVKNWGDSFAYT